MSLEETIKELKEQIEEEEKKEGLEAEQEETVEAKEEPEEKAPEQEDKAEEKKDAEPAETKKEELKIEEEKKEEKPDNAAFARMRREAAAAKKKAEEAEERRIAAETKLAALQNPVEEEAIEARQPEVSPEIAQLLEDHRYGRAEKEFKNLESKFMASMPDYESVSAEYAMGMAQAIRIQNPRLSAQEIADKTKKEILLKAASFAKEGYDPIEELYHEAKDLGFTGKSMKREEPKEEQVKEEEVKPDMKKVAANRQRSTNMSGTHGKSTNMMTKAAAAELTVAEWQALPKDEKRRLLAS